MSYSCRKANLECAIWLLEILNRDNTIEKSIAVSCSAGNFDTELLSSLITLARNN